MSKNNSANLDRQMREHAMKLLHKEVKKYDRAAHLCRDLPGSELMVELAGQFRNQIKNFGTTLGFSELEIEAMEFDCPGQKSAKYTPSEGC